MANIGSPLAFPFPRGKRDGGISLGGRKGGWSKRSSSSFPASTMDLQLCKQKREKRGRGEVFMAGSSTCVFAPFLYGGLGGCGLLFPSTDEHKKGYHVFAPQLCCIHGFSGGHTHTQKRGHGREKTNDSSLLFSVSFAPAPYSEKRGVRQRGRLHQGREGATLDIALLLLLYCRPKGEMVCGKVLSLPLLQMMRKRNPAQRKEEEESVLITVSHLFFF